MIIIKSEVWELPKCDAETQSEKVMLEKWCW